jgi:hypothetical protein
VDRDVYLAALRYEREGYVRAGLTDRVREVDAEIARTVGTVETADADVDVETVVAPSPRRRIGR